MTFRTLVIRDLVLATRIGGGGAMAVGLFCSRGCPLSAWDRAGGHSAAAHRARNIMGFGAAVLPSVARSDVSGR